MVLTKLMIQEANYNNKLRIVDVKKQPKPFVINSLFQNSTITFTKNVILLFILNVNSNI